MKERIIKIANFLDSITILTLTIAMIYFLIIGDWQLALLSLIANGVCGVSISLDKMTVLLERNQK